MLDSSDLLFDGVYIMLSIAAQWPTILSHMPAEPNESTQMITCPLLCFNSYFRFKIH